MKLFDKYLLHTFVFGGKGKYQFDDDCDRISGDGRNIRRIQASSGNSTKVRPNPQVDGDSIPDTGKEYKKTRPYYGKDWNSIRRNIIERDGNCCRICSMTKEEHYEKWNCGIDVHHIKPLRSFDGPNEANKPDNLIAVCRNCHGEIEGLSRKRILDMAEPVAPSPDASNQETQTDVNA